MKTKSLLVVLILLIGFVVIYLLADSSEYHEVSEITSVSPIEISKKTIPALDSPKKIENDYKKSAAINAIDNDRTSIEEDSTAARDSHTQKFIEEIKLNTLEYSQLISKESLSAAEEFRIHQILSKCLRSVPVIDQNAMHPHEQVYDFYVMLELGCKPLVDLIGQSSADLKNLSLSRLQSSAAKGYSAAQLALLVDHPDVVDISNYSIGSVIHNSLRETLNHSYLKESVYFNVLSYQRTHFEHLSETLGESTVVNDLNAWSYLWCQNSHECKIEQEFSTTTHIPHELDTIAERAAEIERAISAGDLQQLRIFLN